MTLRRIMLFIAMLVFVLIFHSDVDSDVLAVCVTALLLGVFVGDDYYYINGEDQ